LFQSGHGTRRFDVRGLQLHQYRLIRSPRVFPYPCGFPSRPRIAGYFQSRALKYPESNFPPLRSRTAAAAGFYLLELDIVGSFSPRIKRNP
jgi:hypothetical protein